MRLMRASSVMGVSVCVLRASGVMGEAMLCDGGSYGCVLRASGCAFHEGI